MRGGCSPYGAQEARHAANSWLAAQPSIAIVAACLSRPASGGEIRPLITSSFRNTGLARRLMDN